MSVSTRLEETYREYVPRRRRERYARFAREFRNNPKALVSLVTLSTLIVVAVIAPLITPHNPYEVNVMLTNEPPSLTHPLGTDEFGRDILSRIMMGARISIYVGLVSVGISTVCGVTLGIVGGYYGGWIDEVLMRIVDAMMSFPAILLALVIMAVLGPTLTNVLIALGFVYTPYMARVTRSATLSIATEEYVEAAQARGEGDVYILTREILPNTMAPVIVQASITFAFAILAEAGLSFLGMGTQPPTPSWGLMINTGREYMVLAPWLVIFPGLAIGFTVIGLNMLGDALRDILDPKVDTGTTGTTED